MNIAILGCGYVGMEAAFLWKKQRHRVTVTTRNPDRLDALSKVAQKALILKGDNEEELLPLIADNDLLVILNAIDTPDYEYPSLPHLLRHLSLEMDSPRALTFASSTAIYGDHQGKWVDETSPLLSQSAPSKALVEAEQAYLCMADVGWSVAVLRCAEIYGPGQELSQHVKQLEGQILPGSGKYYTNMIHRKDCAHALVYTQKRHLEGVFNLADDEHPTRQELYDRIAEKFNLSQVKWDPRHPPLFPANKRVSNHKIKAAGFALFYPERILE